MKILHIFNELKYSGAEIMYMDAAPYFQELGCELYALSTAKQIGEFSTSFEKAGFKVIHRPYPRLRNVLSRIKYYNNLRKLIKKEEIDQLHIHTNKMFWGASLIAKLAGVSSLYTFHNVFNASKVSYLYHFLLRWTSKHLFGCVFQSISDSVYQNELNYFYNKTIKVYNWYGNNRFYPASEGEREKARKELGIPVNSFVIISIGGCSPIKRHSEIIKAFPIISEKIPRLYYLHLGEGQDEEKEKELAHFLGIHEKVFFLGNQKNVRRYLICSDLYLMPSVHEGIPITTIEAMGCKIPSVLYDVPGLRDFNKERETSWLISESYEELAKAVIYLYKNKNIANNLTVSAKRNVDLLFNLEVNAKKIYELYHANR